MNPKGKMKLKYLLCFLCIALFSLAACFFLSSPLSMEEREDTWSDGGFLQVGRHLTIQNTDSRLTLLDSKDVLSANGLYYASWGLGNTSPYTNSDGDTIDIYDAQLYLCLGEHKNSEEAQKSMTKWLDAAKKNYDVLTEEEITCNDQPYCLITYVCTGEDNPCHQGVSVFGVHGTDAICMELTCQETFKEAPGTVLLQFLDSCSYDDSADSH